MSINKSFISKLIKDIEDSLSTIREYVSKPYSEVSEAERYAIRYHLIVIAEALVVASIHIARRVFNARPETPTQALKVLKDNGLINDEEMEDLVSIVRLRNLLVHRYWVIDDERIYNEVIKDFRSITNFLRRLKDYVFKV